MKSTIKTIPETEYPKLMISKRTDTVVIMSKASCGTVLNVGHSSNQNVGDYVSTWDMNNFKPFDGQVVLEN